MNFIVILFLINLCIFKCLELEISVYYPHEKIEKTDGIFLRGSNFGLNWTTGIKMIYLNNDTWTFTLNSPIHYHNDEKLEMKTLINDRIWQIGANEILHIPSINRSSYSYSFFPSFKTMKGSLNIFENIHSKELSNYRNIIIYSPPSYTENSYKIIRHILIMHDGNNLFDPFTAAFGVPWWCQNASDELFINGRIADVLLVGIYNTPSRMEEYTYSFDEKYQTGGKADLYLDFIESTIIPLVKNNYRIDNNVEMSILGSSLGGLVSCYAGYTRYKKYTKVGCMSSSFFWNNEDFNSKIMMNYDIPKGVIFYLDSGDVNDNLNVTISVYKHFLSFPEFILNKNLFFYIDKGASHSEIYWGRRFYIPMTVYFISYYCFDAN